VFGYLTSEMAGFIANSPADILFEIRRISREISEETRMDVYGEWITRPEWITEHKGVLSHGVKNPVRLEMSELPSGHELLDL
jgi:hypothetical protein